MATATEAPASTTAEGPTSHTLFQADRPSNTFGYTREQQIEALHKLREAFVQKEIRYLPRVWCGTCKNSRGQGCNQHSMTKCGKCKQKMPNGGHIDLAYVGHAEATNRLLNVDPFWDWEPLTVDERGLPQVDGYRGLWIRLTVCGMSRLGYGHAGDKTGGDAVKELIGDAIRNAGMRFGMALDLWTSSDLEIIESGGAELDAESKASPSTQPQGQGQAGPEDVVDGFVRRMRNGWKELGPTRMALAEAKEKGLLTTVIPFGDDHLMIKDVLGTRIKVLEEQAERANAGAGV